MNKPKPASDGKTEKYTAALKTYLQKGNEAALQQAYEYGRRCLAEGRSILDMISLHHQAMTAVWSASIPARLRNNTFRGAGEFFNECMSPFEMTHRAFGEANLALRHLNETLEEQVRLIGRDLHDQSGQLLAAIHIELDEIIRTLPAESRDRFGKLKLLLDEVETQLRDLSHQLRPTILDDLGLAPALESMFGQISKRTGLRISPERFSIPRLPPQVELALYRIVQEALSNVVKHARATSVNVRLLRADREVMCSIQDNGCGFDPDSIRTNSETRGLGLLGIQERLKSLRGELQITSVPGKGTKLRISIPVEEG